MRQKIVQIESYILYGLGASMIIIMFINALGRYAFNSSFLWAEEVVRIFFVWAMFVAITDLFLKDGHIGFDVIAKLNRATKVGSILITNIVLMILGGNLVYFGLKIIETIGKVPLPATKLPGYIFFLPGVVSGGIWVVIGLVKILEIPKKMKEGVTQ